MTSIAKEFKILLQKHNRKVSFNIQPQEPIINTIDTSVFTEPETILQDMDTNHVIKYGKCDINKDNISMKAMKYHNQEGLNETQIKAYWTYMFVCKAFKLNCEFRYGYKTPTISAKHFL